MTLISFIVSDIPLQSYRFEKCHYNCQILSRMLSYAFALSHSITNSCNISLSPSRSSYRNISSGLMQQIVWWWDIRRPKANLASNWIWMALEAWHEVWKLQYHFVDRKKAEASSNSVRAFGSRTSLQKESLSSTRFRISVLLNFHRLTIICKGCPIRIFLRVFISITRVFCLQKSAKL